MTVCHSSIHSIVNGRQAGVGPTSLCAAFAFLSLWLLPGPGLCDEKADVGDAKAAAAKIDELLEEHWQRNGMQPADAADDASFLRRVTLDLSGRIPTVGELDRYLSESSPDKRRRLIRQLLDGPEFPLHFGNVLDQILQDRHAGDPQFLAYLRSSLVERKSWERLFREMMLGPWDTESKKPAARFLAKRVRSLDSMTVDTTKAFFGVDISCAKCHDHPLVEDWSQDHFYGMASFLNRTYEVKRKSGIIGEKPKGEVTFNSLMTGEKTAKMMFLSGQVIDEPNEAEKKAAAAKSAAGKRNGKNKPLYSRREQLVRAALADDVFFRRAIVNRLWEYFFGRGLVHPIDQMHSGNEPSVPDLLEWLADDFAADGYDLHRLVEAIVSTRAYQLSSRPARQADIPDEGSFAVSRLRPLGRRQFVFSLLLATGDGTFQNAQQRDARRKKYLDVEKRAAPLLVSIDPRRSDFQSSITEALFISNHPFLQKLTGPAAGNLTERLALIDEPRKVVMAAMRTLLSRSPTDAELKQLTEWVENQKQDRTITCRQLVWALAASAEFRFNH